MFERAHLTEMLTRALRGVNGEVSYDALATHTGAPLSKLRSALNSARRILERDEKIVFTTIRGFGLRRLADGEKVRSTDRIKASIRRASRRGLRRLDAVDAPALLSPADQITMTLNRTVFEVVKAQAAPVRQERKAASPPVPDLSALTKQ